MAPHGRHLPYVLIADADERRIDACIAAINARGCGVLVARNSTDAVMILQRFGPAALVVVDMLLPPGGGLIVAEAARRLEHLRTGVVVWSADRALREFAACMLSGLNARVVGGSAPSDVIRNLVDHMLSGGIDGNQDAAAQREDDARAEETHDAMRALQTRAREIVGVPGIAVYLRDSTGQLRSSGTWTPDEPTPHSLDYLPQALNHVMETGRPWVAMNLPIEPAGASSEASSEGVL